MGLYGKTISMTKGIMHRIYQFWMEENAERFQFRPYLIKRASNMITVGFDGLTPQIYLLIRKRSKKGQRASSIQAEIYFESTRYKGWPVDIIWEFDFEDERTFEGKHFCRWCPERHDFDSRDALWVSHVFEPLLNWINGIKADQVLLEYGNFEDDENGFLEEGRIFTKSEAEAISQKCFGYHRVPLFVDIDKINH